MDPVLYWNAVLLELSRRDFTRGFNNAEQPGPIRTSRAMAIVHLAIHDAVAFRNNPGAAYLNKKGVAHGVATPISGDISAIIAGAAEVCLKALYPKSAQYVDDAVGGVNPAAFAAGQLVGTAMLAHRAGDGSDVSIASSQHGNPTYGQHRADPYAPNQTRLGADWGKVKRFAGAARQPLDDYPGRGVAPLTSDPEYLADFAEVRDSGAKGRRTRTAEQERIGVYWGYDGANNLGVPPRLYNQIARVIVQQHSPALTIARMAELFAAINVAMADAGIDAWYYKYDQDLWRPVVGIREEAAPFGDCFWAPLGAPQTNSPGGTLTPPFPAYPSGHATFGAALMQVLRLGLGTGSGPISVQEVLDFDAGTGTPVPGEAFDFVSDELNGVAVDPDGSVRAKINKHFVSFAEPVWENAVSRVYLGVHWRFDGLPRIASRNVGGVPLGLAVGKEVHAMFNTAPSLGGTSP